MSKAVEEYSEEDLWRDDFGEMADRIHDYVLSALQKTGKDFSYEVLAPERSEVEEGYRYSLEDTSFDFSLAGTVNSEPEILQGSNRRAVFQVHSSEEWPMILDLLEERVDKQINEKKVGPQTLYEIVIDSPYSK